MIWGAIIGAIGGGLLQFGTSYYLGKQRAKTYEDNANKAKEAVDQYTGEAAYQRSANEANKMAKKQNQYNMNVSAATDGDAGNTAFANAENAKQNINQNNATLSGYNQGMSQSDMLNKANLEKTKNEIELSNKQADTNYNVGNQAVSGLTDLIGSGANLVSNISDETEKEKLPESDIEDSLRELETISYKYKHPGLYNEDDEIHPSGFTAQSAEKTELFDDAVSENEDGIKQIDKWKLMESLTAGLSQLQKEIDELEVKKELPIRNVRRIIKENE